jgi:hypothetical protein
VKKLLVFSIIFLVAPGCGKRDNAFFYTDRFVNKKKCDNTNDSDFVRQQEARLTDISVPLNAKSIPNGFWVDEKESAGVMLTYVVSLSLQQIASFYSQEMERLGWDQTVSFDAHEQLLIFEKPGRVCSILLRPVDFLSKNSTKDSVLLTIFTGNKTSSV